MLPLSEQDYNSTPKPQKESSMFQVSVSATQSKQRHFLLDITLNLEIQINDIVFESDHPKDSSSSPTIQEEGED